MHNLHVPLFCLMLICCTFMSSMMQKNLTLETLAERIGISAKAVEKHLSNLKVDGIIKRIGPDKGGHWEVVE